MTFGSWYVIGVLLVLFAGLVVERLTRDWRCQRNGHDWQPDEGGWWCTCCRRELPDV